MQTYRSTGGQILGRNRLPVRLPGDGPTAHDEGRRRGAAAKARTPTGANMKHWPSTRK